jgi:hypothetical protein
MSPWVRIDENAMEHPKIAGLPDGAFRLWVQTLAYCQKYLTDGAVNETALKGLRSYSPKRRAELLNAGLWCAADSGITVHDYLQWNDSKEHVQRMREQGRDRIRKLRGKNERACNAVTPTVTPSVTNGGVTACETRLYSGGGGGSSVPSDSSSTEGGAGETDSARAGAFCQWYEDKHDEVFRVGYMGSHNDYTTALKLVAKFTDAQLRDAALVWFGMDDDFATRGTRTVPKFASRITACLEIIKRHGLAS